MNYADKYRSRRVTAPRLPGPVPQPQQTGPNRSPPRVETNACGPRYRRAQPRTGASSIRLWPGIGRGGPWSPYRPRRHPASRTRRTRSAAGFDFECPAHVLVFRGLRRTCNRCPRILLAVTRWSADVENHVLQRSAAARDRHVETTSRLLMHGEMKIRRPLQRAQLGPANPRHPAGPAVEYRSDASPPGSGVGKSFSVGRLS